MPPFLPPPPEPTDLAGWLAGCCNWLAAGAARYKQNNVRYPLGRESVQKRTRLYVVNSSPGAAVQWARLLSVRCNRFRLRNRAAATLEPFTLPGQTVFSHAATECFGLCRFFLLLLFVSNCCCFGVSVRSGQYQAAWGSRLTKHVALLGVENGVVVTTGGTRFLCN